MMSGLENIAPALARTWVYLYTDGMPSDLREARRAEIDADLWEHQQDARDRGKRRMIVAAEILLRTVLGIPDDLGWRLDEIKARRGAAIEGRVSPMTASAKQIRWMGLCALLGGALMAGGNLVDVVLGHPGRVYTSESSWHLAGRAGTLAMVMGIAVTLLCVLGVIGLYMKERKHAGSTASAGFILLLAGFACMVAVGAVAAIFGVDGGFGVLINVLALPAALLMIPLGFLLLGLGMPSPMRRVPLILGWFLVAKVALAFTGLALRDRFPQATFLYRSDSSFGEATSVLMGLGLAIIGYTLWSGTRAVAAQPANR